MKKRFTMFQSKFMSLKGWVTCLFVLFTVSQAKATFTIWADTVSGANGTQVDISVKVREFTDIISIQGTLSWNVSVATYSSTLAYGLPGLSASNFGTSQVGTGKLTFSWNDANLTGVTVPAGTTIFKVRYTLVGSGGSSTPVTFVNTPTPMEVVDLTFAPIPFVTNPGLINVTSGGPCSVTGITAGSQTPCNSGTNTYTRQVTVSYNNPPGSGTLNVNGQTFAITSSPQTVTLTNLPANGAPVTVTANFSALPGCTFTANNLFTAPPSCASGVFKIFADSVSGNTATQVDVPVRANEFTNIIAAQGTVSWNTSIATYSSVTFFGLPNMTAANFGTSQVGTGKLTFSWNDPTLVGVTVADSAILFTIRFNIVGAPGTQTPVSFVNTPTPLEFTDNSFTVISHTTRNGNIRVNGSLPQFKIFADSVQGPTATTVDCPVRANDFNNLIAAQGTVSWNTTVGTYNTVSFFGLPNMTISNFGTSQVGTGKLTFSWNDPTLVGVTVPDSAILFTIRYNLVGPPGSATPVSFVDVPTPLEFTDNTFTVITHTTRNGELEIIAAGNTITTGTITGSPFCAGATVNVPFTITGTYNVGNVFTAQLSDASGSFASPVTIGTLSGTTAGTIVCTIPGGTVTGTGYRIRVISSNPVVTGSSNTVNITINAIPAAPTITPGGPTTFCAGGSVNLTSSATSGNTWTPGGATTQTISATTSGSYTVTQTVSGCTSPASAPVVVTVNALPSTPTITPGGPTTFCTGGSVTLTSSSTSGNTWSPGGATTQSINVTTSGSYTVQVTNGNGCTATSAPTVVTVNPIPSAPTITPGGPTTFCAGGSVNLTSSASTGNTWSPGGATTQTINATTSGSYTVTQTVSGCTSAASAPVVVTVNPLPSAPTITPGGPTTFCAGGSVTLTSSVSSGNTWSPGGATTQSINATTSGSYTVTQTVSGCTSAPSAPVVVTVNPIPSAPTITPGGPTTFCTGGSVTLTSSSTSGNTWSPGGATTQSINVTTSGTYTVTTTAAGCTSAASAPVTVTVNPVPAAPTITPGGPTTFCAGGSVNLTSSAVSGNTWSPGGATTQTISATASGSYTVTQTVSGCTSAASAPVVVTVNPLPSTPTISAGGPTSFCSGGSVTLTSSSTSGNTWSPGGATTQSINVTASGSYTVQFTDGNGCSATSAPTVVTVGPLPPAPTITPGGPTTFCAGGSVNLTSSASSGNTWTPGGATTQTISATTSGSYTVTQTVSGCTSPASTPVVVTVNPLPSTPTITPGGPTTFCTGGSVTLTSSSASGNLWTPGGATTQSINVTASGSYTVQVTDGNGCSATSAPTVVTVNPLPSTPSISAGGPTTFCSGGSVTLTSTSATNNVWTPGGATTQSINVTTSGTYSVVVDNGGCVSAPSNSITVTVNPAPAGPTITPGGPTTFCAGGSVNLTSSVSTGNTWTPGGATTQTISVTTSGSYTVTQTISGCTSAPSAPVVVTVNPLPSTPTVTPGGPTSFCAGGSVTLTSSSASGNLWTPGGATTQSINVTTSGSYTVQVTDGNGCTSAASAPVNVTVTPLPSAPTITPGGPTTFCAGGSVNLTSSAASGNTWTPGGATTQTISATASGSYTVTQTVSGCTSPASTPVVVTVNPLPSTPTITPGGPTSFCTGGSVTLTSSSASGNLWTPGGATTQSINVTTSGSYTVQVTDGNGCSATSAPTVVTVNPLPGTPSISAGGPTTFCNGGSVTLTSTSATNNVWTPGGATTQSINVTTSGTYSVVVDNGGCVSAPSNSITVTVNPAPPGPTITPGGPTTFCAGGSVILTSSAASGNTWTPGGATTQSITVTTSGSYTVTETVSGCTSAPSAPVVVTVNPLPSTPTITPGGPTTFCSGGSVTLTSSSSSGNTWSPGGATTQSINVTTSGTYTVTTTSAGCTSAASAPVTVTVTPTPSAPTITPGGPTTFCAGGSVTLTSSVSTGNTWTPGGAITQSISATTSGSYTVTQTVSGCTSPASAPVVVTVNPIPSTPTITPGGPTTFCSGGSVTLTSSSTSGNTWSPGGATTQSINVTTSGTYTVTTTAAGCTSAASAPVTVTVNPTPAAPTITPGGPTTFCTGGSVTLTSSVSTGNTWTPGGATTQSINVTTSGSYTVTQTVAGCTSPASVPVVVTVTPPPPGPTITPSGPTTFCAGGSVTLTSSAGSGNTWSPGGATTQSVVVTTSGSYTVTQTISGCTSAPSTPVVITVNPTPSAPTITPGGPTTFCAGGNVTLTSSASSGNTWTPSGATTQSISATASGSYTVTQTVSGCTSPASTPVVVTVNPTPSTPIITPGGPTSFCTGGSVTLTSSSTSGNTWNPGGATTQAITVTASGSYTVQVSNGFGCTATSSPTVVTVNPQPSTPTITPNGPTTFCQGGNVTLTSSSATNNVWSPSGQTSQSIVVSTAGTYTVVVNNGGCTSNPSAPVTIAIQPLPVAQFTPNTAGLTASFTDLTLNNPIAWSWNFGDGGTSSLQNPTHTYLAAGSYSVCLTATNSCGFNVSCQTILVCEAPTAAFSHSGNLLNVAFTDASTGSPVTWAWDFGDGGTSTAQNPSHTYAAPGTYTVCLTATNSCSTSTDCHSVLVVCPAPNAGFTSQSIGFTATFAIQSSSAGTPTYLWDFGDGGTSTQFNPSHTYAAGGFYPVCLTITTECGVDQFCDTITVACPSPGTNFSYVATGLSAAFTDLSTNSPTSWAWDFGDGGTSILQNPSHTYAVFGLFTVCLTATNDCGSATTCHDVEVLTAVEDEMEWAEVGIFPNPAHGSFTVAGMSAKPGVLRIEVTDMYGRLLIAQSAPTALQFNETVALDGLASAVYVVKVSKGGRSRTFRLVKE